MTTPKKSKSPKVPGKPGARPDSTIERWMQNGVAGIDREDQVEAAEGILRAHSPDEGVSQAAAMAGRALSQRVRRPSMVAEADGRFSIELGRDDDKKYLGQAAASHALGTDHYAATRDRLDELIAVVGGGTSGERLLRRSNGALHVMAAIAPRDELEAALAMQMAGTHALALDMLRHATAADTVDRLNLYGGLAVKLQRTFVAQVEGLPKLRNAGKQTVEVVHIHKHENVTVMPGAQAVVSQGGGGVTIEKGNQPHGANALSASDLATGAALWSEEPCREAVPVTRDARQEALPDARRPEPGRTTRPSQRRMAGRHVDERGD